MDLQIFKRPQDAPVATERDTHIRVNYNNQWVDFKNGKIFISTENEPPVQIDAYCSCHAGDFWFDAGAVYCGACGRRQCVY